MDTESIFEQMAERYDTDQRVHIAKIIADEIRLKIGNAKTKSAMDYGCGTGLVGLELIDLFESMVFVDFSVQMLAQMQKKIDTAGIQAASTLCCDFTQEAPSLSVDVMLASQVLLHIKDSSSILSIFYETLNPGGELLVVDFDRQDAIISDKVRNGFVQEELEQEVMDAGFISAESATFYHGEKIFMGKDASLFLLRARK